MVLVLVRHIDRCFHCCGRFIVTIVWWIRLAWSNWLDWYMYSVGFWDMWSVVNDSQI